MEKRKILGKCLLLYFCTALIACDSNNKPPLANGTTTEQSNLKNELMKLKLSSVKDPQITQGDAVIFLLPDGWKYEASVLWDFSNNVAPSNVQGRFFSSDGAAQYTALSTQFYMLQTQMMAMSGLSVGTKYLGSTIVSNGMGSTINAAKDALNKSNSIPKNVSFHNIQSIPIQSNNPADIQARQANPYSQFINETVVMEGKYTENNEQYNMYVFAYVNGVKTPQSQYESWSVRPEIFIIKEDNNKTQNESLLGALYKSFRPTKNFMDCVQQVSQMLSNNFYAGVRQAGEISRQISRNNDAMIASIDAQYSQVNSSSSSSGSGFNDYIKGVENYKDESGNSYQLPDSYSYGWKNGNGEIILSNEHGYNPNIGSTQNWTQLSK